MRSAAGRARPPRPASGPARRPARRGQDARATKRAATLIGWQIMVASALLVLGIIAVAVIFIIHQSLPREQIDQINGADPRVYVDTSDVFNALAAIGVGAVAFAGLVSWVIAGRAVRPLGQALQLQRDFVADASHELRTPLAVLDARLQVLQRRLVAGVPAGSADTAATVKALRKDSRALIDIVNDLLLAADLSAESSRSEPVASGPIVLEAVESMRILAAERNVDLAVEVADAAVRIPPTSLRRCIVSLVDNAVTHSPEGSTVTIRTVRSGSRLVLTVADQGRGIVGIEPERVFERFAHVSAAAGSVEGTPPARQSFGLGLALVRDIATRQGGSVEVESTSSEGTTMRFEIPAVD